MNYAGERYSRERGLFAGCFRVLREPLADHDERRTPRALVPARSVRRQRLPDRRGDQHRRRLRLPGGAIASARTASLAGAFRAGTAASPSIDRLSATWRGGARSDLSRCAATCAASTQQLDAGRGLWLMGTSGTGKTTLAMLVSKAALDAGRSVAIYSLPRLLNLIRETIETDITARPARPPVRRRSAAHRRSRRGAHDDRWVLEQLYSIVNARYQDERAIVATTNLMPDDSPSSSARGPSHVCEMWRRDPAVRARTSDRSSAPPPAGGGWPRPVHDLSFGSPTRSEQRGCGRAGTRLRPP